MSKQLKIRDLIDREGVIKRAQDLLDTGYWIVRVPLHQDWLRRWCIVLERK